MKLALQILTLFSAMFISLVSFAAESTTSVTSTVVSTPETPVQKSTTVSKTTVSTVDDDNIVSTIYAKFAKDAALIGTSLTATSENGIVTLSGSVTAQSQADQAVNLARTITSVKDVRSTINVLTNPNDDKAPPKTPKY